MFPKKFSVSSAQRILRSCGVDIVRWGVGHELFRRKKLIDVSRIDLILDVGANIGQYGNQIRNLGYRERIISFEPNRQAFQVLMKSIGKDDSWDALNIALGDDIGTAQLHIASNSQSSSISALNDIAQAKDMGIEFVSSERVEISTVDNIINKYDISRSRIMLKIDTQGFEREVLDGARNSLKEIMLIQLEAPILQTYRGHFSLSDALIELGSLGFTPVSFEHGWSSNTTGRVFEVDVIFANNSLGLI